MAFSHRRGRPRKNCAEAVDYGTPQLQDKRRRCLTMEPVDLLLAQNRITPEQHWCALHFRWLYTLRYGTVTPRAVDPAEIKGLQHKVNYAEWQEEREKEWKEAIHTLKDCGHYQAILNLCIYNQPAESDSSLTSCHRGLAELVRLWCR